MSDPHNLERFLHAQESVYETALTELSTGSKRTHWMWFIFPQLKGLGRSSMSAYYAIENYKEASAYLEHAVLGQRLRECADAVLGLEERSVSEVFGYPDNLKFHSSMTLFAQVDADGSVFGRVLEKYFGGVEGR
jgi:uncharacterized protein (DUF1810 family)